MRQSMVVFGALAVGCAIAISTSACSDGEESDGSNGGTVTYGTGASGGANASGGTGGGGGSGGTGGGGR